jgi:peptidoglycan/LPS O-acetylase OafA/YrhL
MITQPKEHHRFGIIDALRGIAVLMVVWVHTGYAFSDSFYKIGADSFFFKLADQIHIGRIGVVLFFCISGFVIPGSLRGSLGSGLKRFMIHRILRLYPAYWLSIVIFIYLIWDAPVRKWTWGLVAANSTMVPQWLGYEMIIGSYWTLHIEVLFYIICSLLFVLKILNKEKTIVVCSAASFLLFFLFLNLHYIGKILKTDIFSSVGSEFISSFAYLSIMFWGSLLRIKYDNKQPLTRMGSVWIYLLVGIWLIVLPSAGVIQKYILHNANPEIIRFPLTLAAGMLFFFTIFTNFRYRCFPFLQYTGLISYSIYLFHPAINIFLIKLLAIKGLVNIPILGWIFLSVVFSTIFSTCSYYLIELPFQRMAKRLS